jgi:hypothetical protein
MIDQQHLTMSEQTNSPQMSQQALITYKAISDQFDFLKKQQWATTNYLVLIYVAIAWFGHNVTLPSWLLCTLSAITVFAGIVGAGIIAWFQYDLGQLRKRAEAANDAFFSTHERQALGLHRYPHPYGRGWHILAALILVCVVGAFLVVVALIFPHQVRS